MVKTKTELLAVVAVVFVAAALVSLPYQNQIANAAPMKKYQVYVTLVGVPANAENLIVNGTIFGPTFADSQEATVLSPTQGDTIKLVFRAPAGAQVNNNFFICGTLEADPEINSCEVESIPSTGSGPIRVDLNYPT